MFVCHQRNKLLPSSEEDAGRKQISGALGREGPGTAPHGPGGSGRERTDYGGVRQPLEGS